ncbi:MAG: EamA family transporter [Acidobacteria bacterium]|nr:EamA family transporter [Acidobacteriota bacterium]
MKTRVVAAVVVLSNVAGNAALARGVRGSGGPFEAMLNPWLLAGMGLLALWMLSRMALLSWADLSYVLPVTSIGYALTALAGRVFFQEIISPARWAGIGLIVAGVMLAGRTRPRMR